MKYLEEFSMKRIFDFNYVVNLTGNKDLASGIIQNYLNNGYIKRVKKNLYVTVSLENGGSIPNKFEIGSNITSSSFISLHSAFEFYGYRNQISNEVLVSSKEQFRKFNFDYNEYICRRIDDIEFVEEIGKVKISSLSKTIVDSIDNVNTFDDLEELMNVLTMIPRIDGEKILLYLKHVNKQILFSKTGLILSFFNDGYNIKNEHLDQMKKFGVKKSNYFSGEKHRLNKYYKEWKMHSYDLTELQVDKADENIQFIGTK